MGQRSHVTTGKFHWSGYWRNWSIVLQKAHGDRPFIEISLTGPDYDLGHLRELKVRRHFTPRDRSDRLADQLTPEWAEVVCRQLGEKVAGFFQNNDPDEILEMIDFVRFDELNRNNGGGGVSLYEIIKSEYRHNLPMSGKQAKK